MTINNFYLNKKVKQLIKRHRLANKDNYIVSDFVRFYLVFMFYYKYQANKKNWNKNLKKIINETNWKQMIDFVNNHSCENNKRTNSKLNELFYAFLESIIKYYDVNNIYYFFDKNYSQEEFEQQCIKYNIYLEANGVFFNLLKEILPKTFGNVYNYVKKNKKGI